MLAKDHRANNVVKKRLFVAQAVAAVGFFAGWRGSGADGPQRMITPVGHLLKAVSVCSVGWYFS